MAVAVHGSQWVAPDGEICTVRRAPGRPKPGATTITLVDPRGEPFELDEGAFLRLYEPYNARIAQLSTPLALAKQIERLAGQLPLLASYPGAALEITAAIEAKLVEWKAALQ